MKIVSTVARFPAIFIFLMLFGLYFVTTGGEFFSSDGEIMYQTTERLALEGRLDLPANPGLPSIVPGVDGQYFSKYGIGQPLVSVLLYDAGRVAHRLFFPEAFHLDTRHFFVQSLNMLITPATAVLVFLFARRLYNSNRVAIGLAVLFGIGTSAWPYSKFYFSEPLFGLCVLGSVFCLFLVSAGGRKPTANTGYGERSPALGPKRMIWLGLAGFLLGYALLTRISGAVVLPVIAAYFLYVTLWENGALRLWNQDRGRVVKEFLRDAAAFALPFAAVMLVLLWHNYARFGGILSTGYGDESFSTPFLVGLCGQLLSTGKSVFLYSPIIILAIFTFRRFLGRWAPEAIVFASIIIVNILYFSPWWAWYGGWVWGPRFLVPTLPFFILLMGSALETRRSAILAFAVLFPISIFVQVLGVWVDFNVYIKEVVAGNPANELLYLFNAQYSPLLGHLRYLLEGKAIAIDSFRLAGRGLSPEFAAVAPYFAILLSIGSAAALAISYLNPVQRLSNVKASLEESKA